MKDFVLSCLTVLVFAVCGLQFWASYSKIAQISASNTDFKKLQKLFFIPYLSALLADWLQGPYVYRLYSEYGYDPSQIAYLYIIGFASSVVFGTCTGTLADLFGRKRLCITFTVLYSICCLTKLSSQFVWLAVGRVLGGISTSVLFSTFEAWYVCQHSEAQNFPSDWISETFSVSTFWNGVLAIVAGILADAGADWAGIGPVAPFLMAVPFLIVSGAFICVTWSENYGGRHFNFLQTGLEGIRVIFNNETIFCLGLVQSMFESVMYIFVFMWTPVLDAAGGNWPLGLVFSCYMVCIMMGSSIHGILIGRKIHPAKILLAAVFGSLLAMIVCSWSSSVISETSSKISFAAFLLLEVAVGLYFPSVGYLRSQVIPETLRANIMNWFRVPLNIITCIVLATKSTNSHTVFLFCCVMGVVGLFACVSFIRRFKLEESNHGKKDEASTREKPSSYV